MVLLGFPLLWVVLLFFPLLLRGAAVLPLLWVRLRSPPLLLVGAAWFPSSLLLGGAVWFLPPLLGGVAFFSSCLRGAAFLRSLRVELLSYLFSFVVLLGFLFWVVLFFPSAFGGVVFLLLR